MPEHASGLVLRIRTHDDKIERQAMRFFNHEHHLYEADNCLTQDILSRRCVPLNVHNDASYIVIIPVCDEEEYIVKALKSLMNRERVRTDVYLYVGIRTGRISWSPHEMKIFSGVLFSLWTAWALPRQQRKVSLPILIILGVVWTQPTISFRSFRHTDITISLRGLH